MGPLSIRAATTTTLTATADTYLKSGSANQNQGAETILTIQSSGKNRSLVQFDPAAISTAVGTGTLQTATLELYIEFNSDTWGATGRTVDAHRLTAPWTEAGATWNCGNDTIPSNSAADCSPQWNGGIFNATPTATVLHTNGRSGWIQFNVTADVSAFLAGTADYGWLIKKTDEGQTGQVNYASRQGTAGRAPRLVLTVAVPDTVAPTIAVTEPRDAHVYNDPTPAVVLSYSDDNSGIALDSLHVFMDGVEFTASCANGAASASCESPELAAGAHTITAVIADNAGHPASTGFSFTLHLDVGQHTVTLHATDDTYLRGGAPNQNQGAETLLQIQSSGPNRALVGFNAQDLLDAVGDGTVVSAELQLYIEHNVDNWGDGRPVDAHRVIVPWSDRGATWNCPEDADGSNQQADCAAPWDGGAYDPAPSATVVHTNGLTGWVSFNVTADVDDFAHETPDHGWLIRKTEEGQTGQVHYTARDGICANGPRLVVTVLRSGDDTIAPRLEILSPTDPWQINDATVDINLTFVDLWSGVNPSSLQVTIDGLDITASLSRCPDRAWGQSPTLAEGEHTLTVHLRDAAGNLATQSFTFWVLLGDGAHRLTLPVEADTFLRSGAPNQNEGTETFLRVRESGDNRTLVRVDQADLASVFDAGTFVKAVLELYIEDNGDNWGPDGRTVDIHRMISHWNELGATWNCADDADPANQQPDCDSLWDGGVYAPASSDTLLIQNGQTGWIQFDATADVAAFMGGVPNEGWAVRKTLENEAGLVLLTSREGTNGQHPRLILVLSTGGVIDTTPPNIRIYVGSNELADGACYAQTITPTVVVTDQSSVTRTLRLDGFNYTEGTPITEAGEHTLVVTATDTYLNTAEVIRHFTLDSVGPTFTDIQPPPLACFTQDSLTLRVQCPECVSVSANGIIDSQPSSGFFEFPGVPLAVGVNTISLIGTDACGLSTPQPVQYLRDTQPPTIAFTSPVNGTAVRLTPIAISGTITDANLRRATFNGNPLTVTGGAFTLAGVPLQSGINVFTVWADDCAGNAAQATLSVILDTEGPTITVRERSTGAQIVADPPYNHSIQFIIEVQDNSNATFTAELDNVIINPENTTVTDQGSHLLHVVATDDAGNTSYLDVPFSIDTIKPDLSGFYPDQAEWLDQTGVRFGGVCTGAESVSVNTIQSSVENGLFHIDLEFLDGENSVHVEARDRAQNVQTADLTYRVDSLPPQIHLLEPAQGFITQLRSITVRGEILNEPHLSWIEVNNQRLEPVTSQFLVPNLQLTEGPVVITIRASDTLQHESTLVVNGTADFTPPELTVFANGELLADNKAFNVNVQITADATDNLPDPTVSAVLNSANYALGTTITAEGSYTITVTAVDAAGNTASVGRTFTIDKTKPVFSNLKPLNGACEKQTPISISGNCTDAATISVNGQGATVSGSTFSYEAFLDEGSNAFDIRATDLAGNIETVVHHIILDTIAPQIAILAPADNHATKDSSITVSCTVTDANTSTVWVNSAQATLAGSTYTSSVNLTEGDNLITVTAEDCAKNPAETKTVKVIRDTTCPQIAITSPRENEAVGSATLAVSGSALDDRLDWIKVNGTNAAVENNHFNSQVTLNEGPNTIRVEAADTLGNTCSSEVHVTYDTQSPKITITSPADNAIFTSDTITVSGTVQDVDLKSDGVTVNGLLAVVDGNNFTAESVPLLEGSNQLIARAVDSGGHSSTNTITVFLDTTHPTVAASDPAANASGVPGNYLITVTFSEAMDPASITPQTFMVASATGELSGTTTVSGDKVVFRSAAAYPSDAEITVTLTSAILDKAGLGLTPYAFSFTTLDTQAPNPPSLSPLPSTVCQNPITLAGTSEPMALISVSGGQAIASTTADVSGAFALSVTLKENTLNVLEVRAADASGNQSAKTGVEVTHNCVLPEVLSAVLDKTTRTLVLTFSKAMDETTLIHQPQAAGQSLFLTTPEGSPIEEQINTLTWDADRRIASVTFISTFNVESAFTLRILTLAKDTWGLPLAYSFVKMFNLSSEFNAFLSGEVFDDTTGLPLSGATVILETYSDPKPSVSTNLAGKFTLPVPANDPILFPGRHILSIGKDGFTTTYRLQTAMERRETFIFDARITPLAPSVPLAPEGGHAEDPSKLFTASYAEGTFAQPVQGRFTSLSPQGLPDFLPLGWSPLGIVQIILESEPVAGAYMNLAFHHVEALTIPHLYVAQYDASLHQWWAVAEVSLSDPQNPTFEINASGTYALVYPDAGDTAPGTTVIGSPLPAAGQPVGTPHLTSNLQTEPTFILPTQTARCIASDIEETAGITVPSGFPVIAEVREELHLVNGAAVVVPPYVADLLLYKTTSGAATLTFPVTPTPKAREVVLDVGYDDITLFPFPTGVRPGEAMGPGGGPLSLSGGITLTFPEGAAPQLIPVSARILTEEELPIPLPEAFTFLTAAEISFGTFELSKAAYLSILRDQPLPSDEWPVLLTFSVESDGTYAVFNAPARWCSTAMETFDLYSTSNLADLCAGGHAADDPFPLPSLGVRKSGVYVFATVKPAEGVPNGPLYLSGSVEDRTLPQQNQVYPKAADQFIRSTAATASQTILHGYTDNEGQYLTAVRLTDLTLTAQKETTGDYGTRSIAVLPNPPPLPQVRTGQDIFIARQGPRIQSQYPAPGVTDVPLVPVIRVTFTEPLLPSSVTQNAIVLYQGTNRVAGTVGLSASGLQLTLTLPINVALVDNTDYTYSLSSTLKDMTNNAFEGSPGPFGFRTVDLILPEDIDKTGISVVLLENYYLDDDNEHPIKSAAEVAIAAGSVPQDTVASVERISQNAGYPSGTITIVSAFTDYTFTPFMCSPDDRLLLHLNRTGSATVTIELTPFQTFDRKGAYLDERAAEFTTAEGITVSLEEGSLSGPVKAHVSALNLSTVDYVASPEFHSIAGLDFDLGDQFSKKPIHLTIPLPEGVDPNQNFFLTQMQEIRGEQRLMVIAKMNLTSEGKLTTKFPDTALRTDPDPCWPLQETKECYEQKVLPMLRNTKRLAAVGLASPYTYLTGSYGAGALGAVVEDITSNMVFYLDSLEQEYWANLTSDLRWLLSVPLGRSIDIRITDPDTGYIVYQSTLPPADDSIYQFPDTLSSEIPLPVRADPFLVLPFDLDNLHVVRQFGYTAEYTLAEGEATGTLTIGGSTADGDFITICNLNNDDDFCIGPITGPFGRTFLAVEKSHQFLMSLTRKTLSANPAISLTFNQAVKVLPGDYTFEDPGFNSHEVEIVQPAKAKDGGYPAGERIVLRPKASLDPTREYFDLVLRRGIQSEDDAVKAFPRDFRIRFKVKGYHEFDTTGNFPLVKDLVRQGRVLVVSVMMPVGYEGNTEQAYYLFAYDIASLLSNPGSAQTIFELPLEDAQLKGPINKMKLDPHGRITGVQSKTDRQTQIRLFELSENGTISPRGEAGYLSELFDTATNNSTTQALDVEVYSQDDSTACVFDPALQPTPCGLSIQSGPENDFYTLAYTHTQPAAPAPRERVTVVNKTLQLRWSADAANPTAATSTVAGIKARKGDELVVLVNRGLWGFVPLMNRGVTVTDLQKVDQGLYHSTPYPVNMGMPSLAMEFMYIATPFDWNPCCTNEDANCTRGSDPYSSPIFIEKVILERTWTDNGVPKTGKDLYLVAASTARSLMIFKVNPDKVDPASEEPPNTNVLERVTDYCVRKAMTRESAGVTNPSVSNITDLVTIQCSNTKAMIVTSITGSPNGLVVTRLEPDEFPALQENNCSWGMSSAECTDAATGLYHQLNNLTTVVNLNSLPSVINKLTYDAVNKLLYGVMGDGRIAIFNAGGLCDATPSLDLVTIFPSTVEEGQPGFSSIQPLVFAEAGMVFGASSGSGVTPLRMTPPALFPVSPGEGEDATTHQVTDLVPLGVPKVGGKGEAAFNVQTYLLEDNPNLSVQVTAANRFEEPVLPAEIGYPAVSKDIKLAKLVPGLFDLRQDANFIWRTEKPAVIVADPRAQQEYAAGYNYCKTTDQNDPNYQRNCNVADWVLGDDPQIPKPYEVILSDEYIRLGLSSTQPSDYAALLIEKDEGLNYLRSIRPEAIDSPTPEPVSNPAAASDVFLHSGEYVTGDVDLAIKGRALDFTFARTYNSQSIQHFPMGRGWDHAYNQRLRFLPDGDIEYYDGAGHVRLFAHVPDPGCEPPSEYTAPSGVALCLDQSAVLKAWVLKDPNGNSLQFSGDGRLKEIWDRHVTAPGTGNRMSFEYDLQDRLVAVTDDLGRTITLKYYDETDVPAFLADDDPPVLFDADNEAYLGLLKEVKDFTGRTYTYTYDQCANLVKVQGPDAPGGAMVDNYAYTGGCSNDPADKAVSLNLASNIVGEGDALHDADQHPIIISRYDVLFDKISGQKQGDAEITFVDFGPSSTVIVTVDREDKTLLTRYNLSQSRVQTITDPEARDTQFDYNGDGMLSSVIKPAGNSVQFKYEGDLNASAKTLSRGNLKEITEIPHASNYQDKTLVTTYDYTNNFPTTIQTSEQNGQTLKSVQINRNGQGDPIEISENQVKTASMSWDHYGRLLTYADGGDRSTIYTYDAPAQNGYLYTKQEAGSQGPAITTYTTDKVGNVLAIAPPEKGHTAYAYDLYDRVLQDSAVKADTFTGASLYTYDSAGNLIQRRNVIEGSMNPETGEITPTSASTADMEYDALGYVTHRMSLHTSDTHTTTTDTVYDYDFIHNLKSVNTTVAVDGGAPTAMGQVSEYIYTDSNLLFEQKVRNQAGDKTQTWQYGYTPNGLRETVLSPRGVIAKTIFDGHDRARVMDDAFGTALGSLTETTLDALGNATESRTRDKANNLLSWTTYAYNDAQKRLTDTCQKLFTYPYQEANPITDVCTHTDYYADGKVWKERDALGGVTEYAYDARGMTSTVTDPLGNQTKYEYTQNGNKLKDIVREKIGEEQYREYVTEYTYDDFNRLQTVKDPLGHTTTYEYDKRGNKSSEKDAEDNLTLYEYDDQNRMTKKTEPGGGETTFTYTPLGQTETIADANGHVTKYEYDDFQRQTKTYYAYGSPEQVVWENIYDEFGNLYQVKDPNGSIVENGYDLLDRLIGRTVITAGQGLVGPTTESYGYDALSRMISASNPEVSVAYEYDSLGRKLFEAYTIPELNHTFPITKTYDLAGSRTRTLYPSGRDIRRDYDPLSRLRHVTDYTGGLRQLAQYDYKGLQLDQILYGTNAVPVVNTSFTYDPERKLLSQHTFNPNIQTPASGFGLPASGLDYGWTTGDRRRFRALPQQNGLGNVFKYDAMSRVAEERIGVPNAALAGNNIPNTTPFSDTLPPATSHLSYNLDPVYNFNSVTEYKNGQKEWRQYSTNARNQVTQAGTTMVDWDDNGNMISKSTGYTFKYDFNNRLREAVNPGGLNITYAYDPFNRRIMKKTQATGYGLQATVFVWDDQEVVEEYTKADAGSLQLSKQYVPAQSIDQKISANVDLNNDGVPEAEYFYLQDQLGNVEAIVDNQGRPLEEYEMSGYGNARIYAPDSTAPQVEQIRTLADGKLTLLFTEPVYPDTISADNLKVLDSNSTPATGYWLLATDRRSASFDGTLSNGENYTLNVSGIRDLALNQMAPFSKSFTMAANAVLDDTKAPEIERIWQSDGNVFVSFTEDLAAAGVTADAVQIVRNALPATGTATLADPRTIQFIPDQALIDDASYNLTVATSVADLSGSPLTPNPSPLLFQFTQLPVAFYTRADERQVRSTSAYKNFHLFQGREWDPETNLIYFRNRWHDHSLRIWISEDPKKYNDAYNMYQVLQQDYENRMDPMGLYVLKLNTSIYIFQRDTKILYKYSSPGFGLTYPPHFYNKNTYERPIDWKNALQLNVKILKDNEKYKLSVNLTFALDIFVRGSNDPFMNTPGSLASQLIFHDTPSNVLSHELRHLAVIYTGMQYKLAKLESIRYSTYSEALNAKNTFEIMEFANPQEYNKYNENDNIVKMVAKAFSWSGYLEYLSIFEMPFNAAYKVFLSSLTPGYDPHWILDLHNLIQFESLKIHEVNEGEYLEQEKYYE